MGVLRKSNKECGMWNVDVCILVTVSGDTARIHQRTPSN